MFYSSDNYKYFIFIFNNSIIQYFLWYFKESFGDSGLVKGRFLLVASFHIYFSIFKESLGGSSSCSGLATFISGVSFHIFFLNFKDNFGGRGSCTGSARNSYFRSIVFCLLFSSMVRVTVLKSFLDAF